MPAQNTTSTAKDYYELGMQHVRAKQFELAVSQFDKAISLGANSMSILDIKAACMSRMDDGWKRCAWELAKRNCEKFSKDKNVYKLWYRKADILRILKEYRGAIKTLDATSPLLSRLEPKKKAKAQAQLDDLREKVETEARAVRAKEIAAAKETSAQKAKREQMERVAAITAKTNYIKLLPRDVILTIAEYGSRDNDGFMLRMAGVCRDWREVICHQPGLWKNLKLGTRSARRKAQLWVKRSQGNIRSLKIDDVDIDLGSFGDHPLEGVVDIVRNIDWRYTYGPVGPSWLGAFRNLETLKLVSTLGPPHIAYPLLPLSHPTSRSLKHLHLENLRVRQGGWSERRMNPEAGSEEVVVWDGNCCLKPKEWMLDGQGSQIASVTMTYVSVDQVSSDPLDMFKSMPNIQHIQLDKMSYGFVGNGINDEPNNSPPRYMDSLLSFACTNHLVSSIMFQNVHAPNLKSLDWYGCRNRDQVPVDQIMAPGLLLARPKLESLDIGKTIIDPQRLIRVLECLPSLKFLNVSFCGVDNTFLEALTLKDDAPVEDQLLPKLKALSIAGHESITTGAIKDFMNSRLPKEDRPVIPRPKLPSQRPSSSIFRPTAPRQPTQPSDTQTKAASSSKVTVTNGNQRSEALSSSTQDLFGAPIPWSTQAEKEAMRKLAKLEWLNVDACERIEPVLIDLFRPKLRLISNWLGVIDEDRIRGKGRWSWDGDWTDDCEYTGDGKCHLRLIPGSDKWEVVHVCEEAKRKVELATQISNGEEEPKGWSKLDKKEHVIPSW